MDDQRVGAIFRAVRRRRRLRQLDVAARAGVHQSAVARLEAGHLARLRVETIRGIAAALEIAVPFAPRWHGADLARLLDQDHAALVEVTAELLRSARWEVNLECTFNHFGERGSVDIVAWHPMDRALLLVEVKTRLVDLQDLLSTFGRKLRIVPPLLAQERGWRAVNLGHLVVIADGSTNRRVVARHAAISAQRFRSVAARLDPGCASHASRWLRCGSCHRCALRIASSKPDRDFCQSCSWRMTGCPEARPDRPDLSPMPPAHP